MADEVEYESPLEARPAKAGTASVRDLAGDLVYQLPGCPDLAIRKELSRAWRDFAARTSCWRGASAISLAEGVRSYPVPAPFGGTVASVDGVALLCSDNGAPCGPHILLNPRRWAWRQEEGLVSLAEAPDAGMVAETPFLEVRATYLPLRDSEDAPRWVLDKYGPALAAGALWRLASLEGRAWANATLAARAFSEWKDALSEASVRAIAPDGEIRATNWEGWA